MFFLFLLINIVFKFIIIFTARNYTPPFVSAKCMGNSTAIVRARGGNQRPNDESDASSRRLSAAHGSSARDDLGGTRLASARRLSAAHGSGAGRAHWHACTPKTQQFEYKLQRIPLPQSHSPSSDARQKHVINNIPA